MFGISIDLGRSNWSIPSQMAEPLPERSYPLPSPQPSRELLEASWGLDLTPERDVKPRERLRKSKAPKRLKAHDEGLADEGTCVP